jgi:hypothetical protein
LAASTSVKDAFIVATATVSSGHTEGYSVRLSCISSPTEKRLFHPDWVSLVMVFVPDSMVFVSYKQMYDQRPLMRNTLQL